MKYIKSFESLNQEGEVNENLLSDPNFIAGATTLAALGGTFLVSLIKDLKKAKTKEERKEILKSIANTIDKHAGN
jgi:hypothetical protein